MKRIGIAVVLAIVGALGPVGRSPAAPTTGCAALAVGTKILNCSYKAEGPGTYVAVSVSGWKITVTHAGGKQDIVGSVQTSACGAPFRPIPQLPDLELPGVYRPVPQTGHIPSLAGDRVLVEVHTACIDSPPIPRVSYQVGVVVATEAIA